MIQKGHGRKVLYTAMFLTAFATMAIEILFTRLLSVISYYYLAFLVVSVAMLGMTAGAITVYLRSTWFEYPGIFRNLARASMAFALSVPFAVIIICVIPVSTDLSVKKMVGLAIIMLAAAIPFYFSGIVISALLTKIDLPSGKLYASDLAGASFGALFVLWGIEWFDAVGLIITCALLPALVALFFCWGQKRLWISSLSIFILLLVFSTWNNIADNSLRPMVVKGQRETAQTYIYEKWNSFSRVSVSPLVTRSPQYWSASPIAPVNDNCRQYNMRIDGDAGTVMREYSSAKDIEHLKFDLTSFASYVRNRGKACVIGVGGGKDIQAAILFGFDSVTGIDVNPVFAHLLENNFRDFAGIADHPGVRLVTAEARSYLSQHSETYDLVQMSLVDTWAATGAGAFSLSENNLYTIEAWTIFMHRLKPGGVFTVSRWYDPADLAETGRMISLAMTTLFRMGKQDPTQHIAMVTHDNLATLLIGKDPFSAITVAAMRDKAHELQFDPVLLPGTAPLNPILGDITEAGSEKELRQLLRKYPLNYLPPTDENPYFFNMLRLKNLNWKDFRNKGGVMTGNLQATIVLIALIAFITLLAVLTIAVPLFRRSKQAGGVRAVLRQNRYGALYFSLIGAGFMLAEIALIQRLSVYLGHPVYALGILLFTIVLSAGVGSWLSNKINTQNRRWLVIYPLITAALILLTKIGVSLVLSHHMESDFSFKAISSVVLIIPLGLFLGIFFPVGMRLVNKENQMATPWFWALNGIFSVLFSSLAVFISIYAGISVNFYIAAGCYAILALVMRKLRSS